MAGAAQGAKVTNRVGDDRVDITRITRTLENADVPIQLSAGAVEIETRLTLRAIYHPKGLKGEPNAAMAVVVVPSLPGGIFRTLFEDVLANTTGRIRVEVSGEAHGAAIALGGIDPDDELPLFRSGVDLSYHRSNSSYSGVAFPIRQRDGPLPPGADGEGCDSE